jgi:cell division protein FtsW
MRKDTQGFDYALLVSVMLLLFIGVMMVFSSSFYYAMAKWENKYLFLEKQLIWAGAGVVAMLIFSVIDYRIFRRFSKLLFVLSLIFLGLLFTPLGVELNGAVRWLDLGPLTFMPSEFAKFAAIIFMADFLEKRQRKMNKFTSGLLPVLMTVGLYFVLIYKQPNLSNAITISGILMAMAFVAGANIFQLLTLGAAGSSMIYLAILSSEWRAKRFLTFLDPFKDTFGDGWQVVQSLYALGSGGMFGVGLGQSTLNKLYIPEPQNDFIFATVGEELGFVGSSFLILLFLFLLYRCIRIALNAQDQFGMFLATGITAMVGIHTIINVAVVTSSMPVTGLQLPFISYGGNFLLMLMISMGVMLNISKQTHSTRPQ